MKLPDTTETAGLARWATRDTRVLVIALLVLLGCAIAANVYTARHALRVYRQLTYVRLDPLERGRLPVATAGCSDPARPSIAFVGDSRVARWDPMPRGTGWVSCNEGIPGQTSGQVLLRVRESDSVHPTIAVVQVGINDLTAIGLSPELREAITDQCCRNVRTVVETLVARNCRVVLMTIVPPARPDFRHRLLWPPDLPHIVAQVNDRLRALVRDRCTVFDCAGVFGDSLALRSEYAADALHLNAAGYARLNASLRPVLERVLEEARDPQLR